MECPKCGNEIKETDKKCPYCNKVLLLECPVCHKLNRTSVCEECGNVIFVKCNKCGTLGPNTGKCRKCGFSTEKSVILNETETDEYACLAITFPNIEDLRPALKNKQIFNKFKKKLKQAIFNYAKEQDNRCQLFGETFVIKYYKEFSLTSSVKKAVQSSIELFNKIGGISYKLKQGKNVRLHCKMAILKKTTDTDNNEFNTGLNIKLIKDNTEEKYTDGLQLITDQYVNNIISRDYTLEMIYSSQVGDELIMFYEFPLENHIIPIKIEEKKTDKKIFRGPESLPKVKIYDDDDQLNEILYSNKAIDIKTEGQFVSVPVHNIYKALAELTVNNSFITIKTTERREIPTGDLFQFLQTRARNGLYHIVCDNSFKYEPYKFFKELIAQVLHIDPKQDNIGKIIDSKLSNNLLRCLVKGTPPSDTDPDTLFKDYIKELISFLQRQKNSIILIENFDMIDETSLKILDDYISTLVNVEELALTFVVTVRSEYSVYKNISRLLHSNFYREVNVTRGDFDEFLATIPESSDDIRNTFYMSKLEERCAGSLIYFKNELQHLKDSNIFISMEGKLLLNTDKTLIFPGTIKELFTMRFLSLSDNEALTVAYTILLGGYTHYSILNKLGLLKLNDIIDSLEQKGLITFYDNIIRVENLRIFKPAIEDAISKELKEKLINDIINAGYPNYELLNAAHKTEEKIEKIYNDAVIALNFGDFDTYLNCTKLYFKLLNEQNIKEGDHIERKNELFSILIKHLNRYPSSKVYSISKTIMAIATANNDDETLVNVSNLILDSALKGDDFVLAQQCIHNILTRILNPKLIGDTKTYTPQYVLYSCIHAKLAFNLANYSQCISICEKILSTITPELLTQLENSGADKTQFTSYVMENLVYSALSRIIICDNSLEDFLNKVKETFGTELLSSNHLFLLDKLVHNEEFDTNVGLANDLISMFISNIAKAFKGFDEGFNKFAQNVYSAKRSIQSENIKFFSLLCDLFIGYSYQKLNKDQNWKKCETIYDDVYEMANKSGLKTIMELTNWFKATLLKDKGLYEEAYELITTVSNSIKRNRIKNRALSLVTYILTLNIVTHLKNKKHDIPILVYRINYEAEQYNLESYFQFIEDKKVLDKNYMQEFYESIKEEQKAIEAECLAEEQEDAKEEAALTEEGYSEN